MRCDSWRRGPEAPSDIASMPGGDHTLRNNRIHDGKEAGIFVNKDGKGTIEANDIFGNAVTGVEINERADPTVRRNRIRRNCFQAI